MEESFEKSPSIPGTLEDQTYEREGYMLRRDFKDPTLFHLAIFKVVVQAKASFKCPG